MRVAVEDGHLTSHDEAVERDTGTSQGDDLMPLQGELSVWTCGWGEESR